MKVNINKAFNLFKLAIITPSKFNDKDNKYVPLNGLTKGDRKGFWDNYDSKRIEVISEINNKYR